MERYLIPSIVVAFLFLASCSNPVEEYGTGLTVAYKNSQVVAEKVSMDVIRQSIKTYYASNGEFPPNVEELSKFMRVELNPDEYDYDPSNGKIIRKQP